MKIYALLRRRHHQLAQQALNLLCASYFKTVNPAFKQALNKLDAAAKSRKRTH